MDATTETAPYAREGDRDTGAGYPTSHVHPLDGLEDEATRADSQRADSQGTDTPRDDTGQTTAVPVVPAGGATRSVGSNRHLASVVLALVAMPAGYGFTDYAWYHANQAAQATAFTRLPDRLMIMMAAAAACFLVATLAGRISAMGPLVAALVWGVAPAAWVMLDYPSYVDRLNDLPEFWGNTGFGLATVGFAVFPAVAGLLLGVAVAGKWRRPVPASRW